MVSIFSSPSCAIYTSCSFWKVTSTLLAFLLLVSIPQKELTALATSRHILELHSETASTNHIWRRQEVLYKALSSTFSRSSSFCKEEKKIGFEEISLLSASCYYGNAFQRPKTCTSHELIFPKYNLKSPVYCSIFSTVLSSFCTFAFFGTFLLPLCLFKIILGNESFCHLFPPLPFKV